jgi:endonuclease G
MKKLFILPIFALFAYNANAAEQVPPLAVAQCAAQVPYGMPSAPSGTSTICRKAYLLNHDGNAKIAVWTAHTLTAKNAVGCLPREDAFAADQSLARGKRAELADYLRSGYDQGHMVSNADLSWDRQAANESFYLSNMSPQLPGLNRGIWKLLETGTRAYAHKNNTSVTVYAGNMWYPTSKTIGPNKVVVPDYLFKIIIDNNSKKTFAFIFPNKEGLGNELPKFQVSVADVEKATGLVFPVPDAKTLKNALPIFDYKKIADDKKSICK